MSAAVRPHVLIRAMQSADLKAVAAVEKAAYVYPWSLGIFRDCMLAGYHCMVLDVDGHVGGYGIMSIAASEAHLLNICVHPDWQSLGYGRRMLNALLNRAGHAGAETVFLEVRPSNSVALSLYHSVGFRHIGVRPGYYQAEGGREDAVVLAMPLGAA
jgi:[ribosomal protein S18]-alanine N-acetyltransferase